MIEYKFHEFADIFPLMDKEDSEALKKSIQNKYLEQYPILLYEDKILDGRNRYNICKEFKITPFFGNFDGSKQDAVDFVWSSNFDRRHLSSVQKVLAREQYIKEVEKINKIKQQQTQLIGKGLQIREENNMVVGSGLTTNNIKNPQKTKTRDIIAHTTKTSSKTVDIIRKAKKLEDKHPKIKEKLDKARKGDKTITVKSIQTEIKKIENIKKTQEIKETSLFKPIIYEKDVLEFLNSLKNKSINLLLTDPPYITDINDIDKFVDSWVLKALSKIKDNGKAYIFTSSEPEEIQAYLRVLLSQDRFILSNILVWTYRNTLGPDTKLKYKNNWQAIFYLYGKNSDPLYTNSLNEKFSVKDISAPDGRQGNRFYKWQKPDELAELIIKHATKKRDIIIDPFAGSGTFILKGCEMNREIIGSDINKEVLDIAKTRGCIIK